MSFLIKKSLRYSNLHNDFLVTLINTPIINWQCATRRRDGEIFDRRKRSNQRSDIQEQFRRRIDRLCTSHCGMRRLLLEPSSLSKRKQCEYSDHIYIYIYIYICITLKSYTETSMT